jgi:hypothetical protein
MLVGVDRVLWVAIMRGDAERRRSERSFKADSYSKSGTRVMSNRGINVGASGGRTDSQAERLCLCLGRGDVYDEQACSYQRLWFETRLAA